MPSVIRLPTDVISVTQANTLQLRCHWALFAYINSVEWL
jgi:hypothetical protein